MIKSIRLQNFEAHEDTTVHFGQGLQLLVGKSNSGKSSLLRALRMVVNNDWDKSMVRMGYEFCRVRVETDRGWVEAERGEKVNNWRCCETGGEEQFYQKVGTSVPELATRILGMGERDRGAGIKELPNFQTQLEKHYMLSEIGDKKASSNMIAVMMDNAIGLGGMEDLIKDLSADLLKDRKWLNEKQSEIVELKSHVMDEAIFNQYEKDVKAIGKLDEAIKIMSSDIEHADAELTEFNELKMKSDEASRYGMAFSKCGEMEHVVEELDSLYGKSRLVEDAGRAMALLDGANLIAGVAMDAMDDAMDEYCRLDGISSGCSRIIEHEHAMEKLNAASNVDVVSMETLKASIDAIDEKISDAERDLANARDIWKKRSNA